MDSERGRGRAAIWALAALAMLAVGCGPRTVLDRSTADRHGALEDELDFWDGVAEQPVVTNNDALHGLLMLRADDRAGDGWPTRIAAARDHGWIGPETDLVPNEAATIGIIAVAVCEILDWRGGLTMTLLGPSPRYCTRELVYAELLPLRTENQSLRGSEFVDLVGEVETRRQERSMREPALADVH